MKYLELRDEEYAILEALVGTPAFELLKKITRQQREIIKERLVSAQSVDEIRTLQGQIAGVNQITSIPDIIAKARKAKRAAERLAEERTAKRGRKRTT